MMDIHEALKKIPSSAGVYQYFDRNGRLLYVGKAKNLKKRVRSYWRISSALRPRPDLGPRITKMLEESASLDYIVVESEEDALILENSLIKQLKPKYNILLRDDKTYPYIYIDKSKDFPRFELTRRVIKGKKISYYGPFTTGGRSLLESLYEIFPLVQKKGLERQKKACLFHQIGRCPAPCEQRIDKEEYAKTIEAAQKAIKNLRIITEKLSERMLELARQERFEEAATLRDRIESIKKLRIHSDIDTAGDENYDIIGILNGQERGVVVKLFMRDGKIVSTDHSFFRHTELFDSDEAYRQTLLAFYESDKPDTPCTVMTAHEFEDMEAVSATLSRRLGHKIEIVNPKRGLKARLVRLALKNARELLKLENRNEGNIEKDIAKMLSLQNTPWRVEVFDNSHLMGEAASGAMVVWSDGGWEKTSYRHYTLEERDEYAQMREMLQRRIESFEKNPPPDLWLLDGGGAAESLALRLLEKKGVSLDVVAIAKEKLDSKAHRAKGSARDTIYHNGSIYRLDSADRRLQWLQMLRDEAHRFAIEFHRKKKREQDKSVSLLRKKGIGEATLKKLLDYFGTFENINSAEYEEIKAAAGKNAADAISRTDI